MFVPLLPGDIYELRVMIAEGVTLFAWDILAKV
jgi:hypothetical protein